VGPHRTHEGPRGLVGYSYLKITRFLVVQTLSNEMVETTETAFFENDAF
jgi:hypothetical protein